MAGNVAGALGDPRGALVYLRESMEQDAQPEAVARTRVLIAAQLRALGDLRGAERELVEAQRDGSELTRANATAERARLRRAQRDFSAALADARAADASYESLGLDFDRIETHTVMSQSLIALGNAREALAAANAAIAIEQRIRVGSANPEWRARFLAERYSPYEARIAAELAAGGDDAAWQAFRTTETVRARSLAEQLAARMDLRSSRAVTEVDPAGNALRAELTAQQLRLESRMDRGGADPAELSELRRSIEETRARIVANELRRRDISGVSAAAARISGQLRDVQAAIPADTAVLAYFVGDENSHAWLLTRDSLQHATLAGRTGLQRTVDAFVAASRSGAVTPASRAAGRNLLGSLLDHVTAKRLLVIADGPLYAVPFAALQPAASSPGVLVERFVISYAPSLALAMHAPSAAGTATRVAVISDPVYAQDDSRLRLALADDASAYRSGEQPRDRLTRLQYSGLEGRTVARAFAGRDTVEISGFDATPERVLALRSQPLSVLHFATHARIRRDSPEQSALYLSEYSASGRSIAESRLTADEISRTGLRADLVVLSACATGDGGAVRGEGVLGLTYAFLANGSRSVVASLWPIQDASTARFMKEFYDAYRKTGRAADALRTAQLHERGGVAWTSFVVRANEFP
jgi:CHAT domain-containing protein